MKTIKSIASAVRLNIMEGILVTLAFVFFLLTIKQGHDWGDDFAQYISHGKNIAEGTPYKNTGYIFNSYSWWIGPQTYPPVFPFLLSTVYVIYGLNLNAMRIMILICYLLFLITFVLYCKKILQSDIARISALLMVAFSPLHWDIKNSVISEIPFLMFFYFGLLLSDKIETLQQQGHKAIVAAIAFGVVCYLAYGTRSVGLFLIVAYFISQLYNRRGNSSAVYCPAFLFVILFVLQDIGLHTDKSYIDSMEKLGYEHPSGNATNYLDNLYQYGLFFLNNITRNLVLYMKEIKWYWESGSNGVIAGIVAMATGLLCGLGFIRIIKVSVSTGDVFFVAYFLFLLAAPFFQGTRYLLPIFPLYAIYIFKAFDYKLQQRDVTVKKFTNMVAIAVIASIYVVNYFKVDYSPYKYGIGTQASKEMFDYIKNDTPRDSLIIFQKPRAMALLGERKSSSYHYGYGKKLDATKIEKFLRDIKATHIVISKGVWGEEEWDLYVKWVKSENTFLVEKYHNSDFSVYGIRAYN
ncbi:MAG: phospholipid carrier-dependent glycosyltransferase [Methylococcales bacterium]